MRKVCPCPQCALLAVLLLRLFRLGALALVRCRLVLDIVDHAVVARIEVQTSRLSLYEFERLSSNGPRRKPKADSELLAACHERLHGASCPIKGCAGMPACAEWRRMLRNFGHARRSSQRASARSSNAAAMQRSASIRFDFANGSCEFEAGQPSTPSDVAATSPCTVPVPKAQKRKVAADAAPATAPAAVLNVVARLELQEGRVRLQLRVGGREQLDFGAAPREAAPRRASALAAGASRARSEQQLEQALAEAEAGEVERGRSQELERQLAAERAEKEALARRAAAAEEAAVTAAAERAAAEAAAAEQLAAVERTAAERLAKQKARSAAALEKARGETHLSGGEGVEAGEGSRWRGGSGGSDDGGGDGDGRRRSGDGGRSVCGREEGGGRSGREGGEARRGGKGEAERRGRGGGGRAAVAGRRQRRRRGSGESGQPVHGHALAARTCHISHMSAPCLTRARWVEPRVVRH